MLHALLGTDIKLITEHTAAKLIIIVIIIID